MKWDTVCRPKSHGGLAIRKCCDNNLAINAKLGWELMNGSDRPWVKLIRDKYGCGANPRFWAKKTTYSHIRKCIFNTKDILASGATWIVRNGANVSVMKDWWCGHEPINSSVICNDDMVDMNVSSLISHNGCWKNDILMNTFPSYVVDAIISTPLPLSTVLQDSPPWIGKSSGKFSIFNCYDNILFYNGTITNHGGN